MKQSSVYSPGIDPVLKTFVSFLSLSTVNTMLKSH